MLVHTKSLKSLMIWAEISTISPDQRSLKSFPGSCSFGSSMLKPPTMTPERTDLQPDLFSAGDKIYFDHNATSPVCRKIISAAPMLLEAWGNPSSIHQMGRKPKRLLREARTSFAKFVDCHPLEVIFTSGGSESNSLVIKSEFLRAKASGISKPRFVSSRIEHPASIKTLKQLQEQGLEVGWIDVDREGKIDIEKYKALFNKPVQFVTCMAANNETGVILPIKELCKIAQEKGAKFHTDAVQALGKMDFSLKDWNVDFASFAGHKFYTARGVGVLFSKSGNVVESLVTGGGQERSRRGGTENIFAISSLGMVCDFYPQRLDYMDYVAGLRNELEAMLIKEIQGIKILGVGSPRVCNTSSVFIDGVDGESLLMNLDMAGIAISTGAACSSGNPEPSPVLMAMGLTRAEAQSSMRVSLGWGSTMDEVHKFVKELKRIVNRLREINNQELSP